MNWLVTVLLLMIVVFAAWMVYLGRQILQMLQQIISHLRKWRPPGHDHPPTSYLTNYSTWTYRNGIWEIVESRAELGFVPGDPPRRPGAYEGETVRRPAVRGE